MSDWITANKAYLSACIDQIREGMEEQASGERDEPISMFAPAWNEELGMPEIERLSLRAGLSPFGRQLLLLCVGMELDSRIPHLCAKLQENETLNYPTFSLALRLFKDGHWDAIAGSKPLRRYRLVNVAEHALATQAPLSVDARVWHHLLGIDDIDARLERVTEPLSGTYDLVPSHQKYVGELLTSLKLSRGSSIPIVQLCGASPSDQLAVAHSLAMNNGLPCYRFPVVHLPEPGSELEELTHLMEREFILDGAVFVLDTHVDKEAHAPHARSIARLISQAEGLLVVTARERSSTGSRETLGKDIGPPSPEEQEAQWLRTFRDWPEAFFANGDDWMMPTAGQLTNGFVLDGFKLKSAASQALGVLLHDDEPPFNSEDILHAVWDGCRAQVRPGIEHLAQRLTNSATWDELILPPAQRQQLYDIEAQVRNRMVVHHAWAFGGKTSRGKGNAVMFSGPSGTGKTLAAEALATRLRMDLFKVDLGATVSKYIGETEKNLARIFDAAECGGSILLFDEADSLFGKRSEVKDAKDRYANIEVSYLLQRLETFTGLIILTTNLRDSIDQAFMRRLRTVIEFPFPNAEFREQIWRRSLQGNIPLGKIEYHKLARLSVSGGTIRNIAMSAVYSAASDVPARQLEMVHLRDAAKMEFLKSQHILTQDEVGDWV